MADRRLYGKDKRGNIIGEWPHDPVIGWEKNRHGVRRVLCSKVSLAGLTVDQRAQHLEALRNKKMWAYYNKEATKQAEKKRRKHQQKQIYLKQAINLWLKEASTLLVSNTALNYRLSADVLLSSCGNIRLADFDREHNIKFLDDLKNLTRKRNAEITISKATQNKHTRHVQAFFNWALENEYLSQPVKIKKPRVPRQDPQTFSLSDLNTLKKELEKRHEQATGVLRKRNAYNLLRAYWMCTQALLRIGAVWSLRLDHIKLVQRIIQIRDNRKLNWVNKAGKWPDKPINNRLYEFLEQDLKNRPTKEVYFLDNGHGRSWCCNTNYMSIKMKKIQMELGLPDVKPFHHGFRATMITELLAQGTNPVAVQMLADHSNLSTTMQYLNHRKINQQIAAEDIPEIK